MIDTWFNAGVGVREDSLRNLLGAMSCIISSTYNNIILLLIPSKIPAPNTSQKIYAQQIASCMIFDLFSNILRFNLTAVRQNAPQLGNAQALWDFNSKGKEENVKMNRQGGTFRTPQVPKIRRSKSNEHNKRKSLDSNMVFSDIIYIKYYFYLSRAHSRAPLSNHAIRKRHSLQTRLVHRERVLVSQH